MPNMFVFTGENAFLLREEKSRWTSEFGKKYGEENCVRVPGSTLSVRELLDEVTTQPFLAEKRMIISEGIPKATKEEIQALHRQIHPSVLLVFIEPKIDKRIAASKELLSLADVKEFEELKGKPLQSWLLAYAKANGVTFKAGAEERLIEFIGENQDMLSQEVQKLSVACKDKPVTADDIERLVIPTDEGVIWKISDMLGSGQKNRALEFAHRMLARGGDAYGLWSILLHMLKNLTAVKAAMESGHSSGKDIAVATGIHPFAVRSLQSHAKNITLAQLKNFVTWAAQTDVELKTGLLRTTEDAQQEIHALVDSFILRCP